MLLNAQRMKRGKKPVLKLWERFSDPMTVLSPGRVTESPET